MKILIFREGAFFNAICLEMDIVACGLTAEGARQNLYGCMVVHMESCLEEDQPDQILRRAPQEYWDMYGAGSSDG